MKYPYRSEVEAALDVAEREVTALEACPRHDLIPVVSCGELVASLCLTCDTQCDPEAWIAQADEIRERHWADRLERVRLARIAMCDDHDPPTVDLMQWGQVEPVTQLVAGPCPNCGTA